MPQHADMHRERQLSGLAGTIDHASNTHLAERLAALIDEDVGPLYSVCPLPESDQCRRQV
jgi:hypothetical protein